MSDGSDNTPLFRDEALKALANTSQFDDLIQLTRPHAWLLLAACVLIVVAALTWALTGAVAVHVSGQGILLSDNATLRAVAFVPAAKGKRIETGMPVLISPSTVKKAEFGSLYGTVSAVSTLPVTPEAMHRILQNTALVKQFLHYGAPIMVSIHLERDPKTYSGFRWSSSQGPRQRITAGTLIEATIQVETKKPIALLLPTLFPNTQR